MTSSRLALSRLWVLMVTAFVDMIGFALLLPLLPLYATQLGATPLVVGFLISSFAIAQLISSPLWGRLSDRIGRRPVILGSQALAAISYLVFAYADAIPGVDAIWLFLLSRIFQGIGGGTMSVTQAYVSDSVLPEERAKALGWLTACTSAGVMVGPAIGSLAASEESPMLPGLIAAGLCILNILFAWRWLPESVGGEEAEPGSERRSIGEALRRVVSHPLEPASALIWIYTAGMMAFMAMNAVMALYLQDRFGITVKSIGFYYMAVAAVSVVVRALVLGAAVDRFGEVRVLRFGAFLLAMGMALAPFAPTKMLFLFSMFLIPIGTAFLFPSTTSLVSRHSRKGEVGQTLGVQQTFGGMSRVTAPLWATAVYQHFGLGQPFWVASALVWITVLFALRVRPQTSALGASKPSSAA